MKKIFQNIIDRLHLIYVALTKKHFVCAYYNSVSPRVRGGGFVEQFSSDKKETESFIDAMYESSKQILNEK